MTSQGSAKFIRPGRLWNTRSRSSIYGSSAPLAEASIARDLEDESDSDPENPIDDGNTTEDDSESDEETLRPATSRNSVGTSMVGSYRRPSFTMAGSRATVGTGLYGSTQTPTKRDRREARREERSLLRDNNIIPPKHPRVETGLKRLADECHDISQSLTLVFQAEVGKS